MSEIVRLKPTKKFFEIIERAKGDKDQLARMMAEVRKEAFVPGLIFPQSDPLFEQEPKIESDSVRSALSLPVIHPPVLGVAVIHQQESIALFQDAQNLVVASAATIQIPRIETFLQKVDVFDWLPKVDQTLFGLFSQEMLEEWKEFRREFNEAVMILGHDPNQPSAFDNVDVLEIFAQADAKRNIDQMIRDGQVDPRTLLQLFQSALQQPRKAGRPKGKAPLSDENIKMVTKIEARTKKGLSVEPACNFEGVSRATYYRWKKKAFGVSINS